MGKNTGKTTTINYLLDSAAREGLRVGLTSTGRDGEVLDVVSNLPKPSIQLPTGSVLATSRDSLNRVGAGLEILENTGVTNPLGEIVIASVRRAGTVEVSGPERTADLRQIVAALAKRADLVLVDGALDRRAASAPALSRATVLATGAAVANTPHVVAAVTAHQVELLTLPKADCPSLLAESVQNGEVAVWGADGLKVLPLSTAVDGPAEVLDFITGPEITLGLGGALADELLELLVEPARRYKGLQIVVRDGTCLFVSAAVWQRFRRAGGEVRVLSPIHLAAITVNPVDPRGRQFPIGELEAMLQQLLEDIPVFNPVAGGGAGNLV